MSGNLTTSASDLVLGGLLQINAYSPGQTLNQQVGSQVLQILNDMVDSLSTDQAFIYTQTENVLQWTPGQYQYTIGNPTASNTFGATAISGSNTLTGVTVSNLTITYGLNASGTLIGGSLTDTAGFIPAGTTIVSTTTNTVTMSQNALASGTTNVSYTIPGNFAIARPLRVRNSFTRVTTSAAAGLDYFIDIISYERYNEIGLKTVPGPWPYVMA